MRSGWLNAAATELGLVVRPVHRRRRLEPVVLGQQGEVHQGEVVVLARYDPHGSAASAGDSTGDVPVGASGGEAVAPATFPASSSRNARA
jgi:hypothetical protein